MEKAYEKIVFVNDQAPDLDADNLNSISDAIDTIDDRVVEQDALIDGLDTRVSTNTTNISTNTADIADLKSNTGFEISSASPLHGCSASSIVGIDVDGCSTQGSVDINTSGISNKNISANGGSYSESNQFFSFGQPIDVRPSSTYKLVTDARPSSGSTLKVYMGEWKTDGSWIERVQNVSFSVGGTCDIAIPSNVGKIYIFLYADGATISGTYLKLMDGTPTPTNPIAIVDASGDVIAIGKNLINCTMNTSTLGNVTCTKNADGTYTLNGTASANHSFYLLDNADVKSFLAKNVGKTLRVCGGVSSGIRLAMTGWKTDSVGIFDEGNGATIENISDVSSFSNVNFRILVMSGTVCNNVVVKPMVCYDTSATATDYVAYASNKITLPTLRSVGTVKDELIVNSDGSGQIIKRIGTKDLSTLTWNWNSAFNAYACDTLADISVPSQSVVPSILWTKGSARTYNEQSSYTSGMITVFASSYASSGKRVLCRTTSAESTSEAPSGTIYYALATPTTTTLTASEVSAIRALQTYSGTTIIDSALDVQSVTYHAGVKEYIDWRFEQLATLMLGEE